MKLPQRLKKWRIGLLLACCVLVPVGVKIRQSRLNSALVAAVRRGDVAATTAALQAGADPNARNVYEHTPRNPVQVIHWILRKDDIVWHDEPVLITACESEQPFPLATILLERGADPDGRDNIGYTALLELIQQDEPELVKLLLEHGASVDARTPQGDTALMLISQNQFATVKSLPILIEHGARLDLRNNEGKTALQRAREKKHTPAIRVLMRAGAKE